MKRILIIIFAILLWFTPSVLLPSILDYFNYVDSEKPLSTEEKRQPDEKGVLYLTHKWYWFDNWYLGLGDWETSRNGDEKYLKYSGSILNGEPFGIGHTKYYPSGCIFFTQGLHKNGILISGSKTSPSCTTVNGKWKRGKLHGHGSQRFQDGRFAMGKFKEGKFWNVEMFDKNWNIIRKWENGVEQK